MPVPLATRDFASGFELQIPIQNREAEARTDEMAGSGFSSLAAHAISPRDFFPLQFKQQCCSATMPA